MALAPEEVGARIRQARLAKGWTHEEFARQAGVGLRTVQRWQKGRSPKGESWLPRLTRSRDGKPGLMELADLFEVPRGYFVEMDDPGVTLRVVLERVGGLEDEVAALRRELHGQADPGGEPEEQDEPDEPRAGHR